MLSEQGNIMWKNELQSDMKTTCLKSDMEINSQGNGAPLDEMKVEVNT